MAAMGKFALEPDGEVTGVYRNGETWQVKFDSNGQASVKDEDISETLTALAAVKGHPITIAKGSK